MARETMQNLSLKVFFCLCLGCCSSLLAQSDRAQATPNYERKESWHGFDQFHFRVADRAAYVVVPPKPAIGNPWVWRARFPGYHAEMDIELVKRGFHLGYVNVAGMFGSPKAIEIGNAFYDAVTTKWNLAEKPALEGVSRGGLFVYNWMAQNPDKVACIYCDTPVCDFTSWPAGQGTGIGSEGEWKRCLAAYSLTTDEAKTYDKTPIGQAKLIAETKIPILHIVSESDRVVPPNENTYRLNSSLQQFGHSLQTIVVTKGTEKSHGHHFDHPDPDRVVRFISRHASLLPTPQRLLRSARRIVFLGDSITYAGHYVTYFDSWLLKQPLSPKPLVVNVGLPSETVSGLSEKGHAGGRFPRPHLKERLHRVLQETKPDLVIACYGINCGIYQPFDQHRFEAYQRGLTDLRKLVRESGAEIVFVTPPTFDDKRSKNDFSYDAVMDRYATELLKLASPEGPGWNVIDLHGPMKQELQRQRTFDPEFTFQPDSVHPNKAGHWFIAKQLIRWFVDGETAAVSPEEEFGTKTLQLAEKRMSYLRNAYLSAAGHKRPGIKAGVSLTEAHAKALELTEQLNQADEPVAK